MHREHPMNTVRALTDLYSSFKRPNQLNWSFGLDPCGQPDCRFSNIQASIIDDTGRLPRCNWQGIECKDWNVAILYVVHRFLMLGTFLHTATSLAYRPRRKWRVSSRCRDSCRRALATSQTFLHCACASHLTNLHHVTQGHFTKRNHGTAAAVDVQLVSPAATQRCRQPLQR